MIEGPLPTVSSEGSMPKEQFFECPLVHHRQSAAWLELPLEVLVLEMVNTTSYIFHSRWFFSIFLLLVPQTSIS